VTSVGVFKDKFGDFCRFLSIFVDFQGKDARQISTHLAANGDIKTQQPGGDMKRLCVLAFITRNCDR